MSEDESYRNATFSVPGADTYLKEGAEVVSLWIGKPYSPEAGGCLLSFRNVHLTEHARTSLVTAAVEVYPRETTGLILCKPRVGGRVVVDGVYSIQTAERKWSSVKHGNLSAIKRLIGTISLLDGKSFIGGFHSHPDSGAELSDEDVEHIRDEMNRFTELGISVERWLEVVVSITRKNYSQPKRPGWSVKNYEKKLGLTLRTPDRNGKSPTGYGIVAGAYWLYEEASDFWSREVKVRLTK
jgi:proteasome lid subunit RPN8/RPN11